MKRKIVIPARCYRSYEFLACLTIGELQRAWFNGSTWERAHKPTYTEGEPTTSPVDPEIKNSTRFSHSGRGGFMY
jgi:hypothetical protein